MDFINYYAVLNLPLNATTKAVQVAFDSLIDKPMTPEMFEKVTQAYAVLSNRYRRARYDRTIGHLVMIQVIPEPYLSAVCYTLNYTQTPHTVLSGIIQQFKALVADHYDIDWAEALTANCAYSLESTHDIPCLLLQFPVKSLLDSFIKSLIDQKIIKA